MLRVSTRVKFGPWFDLPANIALLVRLVLKTFSMQPKVLRVVDEQFKIIKRVVQRVVVLVVNYFILCQRPSQVLLHYIAMLKNPLPAKGKHFVAATQSKAFKVRVSWPYTAFVSALHAACSSVFRGGVKQLTTNTAISFHGQLWQLPLRVTIGDR